MRAQEVVTLFDYNCWANNRLLEKYADLARELAKGDGSMSPVKNSLIHILDAERGWRSLVQTGTDPPELTAADFPTSDALKLGFNKEQEEWRAFLGSVDDSGLDGAVEWTNPLDERTTRPLWQVLYHVFNHGTQHRAEVAASLSERGSSPGDVDFVLFLWEREHPDGGLDG